MPLVKGVVCTANPEVGFKDVDAAFMVGAMPRREGMERKDLLAANVKIFKVFQDIFATLQFLYCDREVGKTLKLFFI